MLNPAIYTLPSFSVVGKEGSSDDGVGFVERLWKAVDADFSEIADLALRDSDGEIEGFWGLMSDMSRSFKPWENDFSRGLYLAGVQVAGDAVAPSGWMKWTAPARTYLKVPVEDDYQRTFRSLLAYMQEKQYLLAGAVYDFRDPKAGGRSYLMAPIGRG